MAVAVKWFTKGQLHMANGDIIWKASGGSTIKVALFPSTITINQDTDETIATHIASELTGTGYTARGAELTLSDPATGSGTHQIKLDAADVVWTITGTLSAGARYGLIYKDTGNNSTSYLLGWVDFDADKNPEDGTLTIQWDTNGILTMSAS